MTRSKSCAQFGIDFDYDVGRATLWLHGELDALSVPVFSAVLTAVADRGTRVVTIDLSRLRFCNVGGLRAMAELAARLNAIDGRVEIVDPSILTRMLEISDLHSLFELQDSRTAEIPIDPVLDSNATMRAPRSSRPRSGSLHRLSTGA